MLNFPKIPKIALRKFSELSHSLWRSKRAKSTQDSFLLGGSSYASKTLPPVRPADALAREGRLQAADRVWTSTRFFGSIQASEPVLE